MEGKDGTILANRNSWNVQCHHFVKHGGGGKNDARFKEQYRLNAYASGDYLDRALPPHMAFVQG